MEAILGAAVVLVGIEQDGKSNLHVRVNLTATRTSLRYTPCHDDEATDELLEFISASELQPIACLICSDDIPIRLIVSDPISD